MYEQAIVQLRALATSDNQEVITRYRAICVRRDHVLAQAVENIARSLMEQSGYQPNPDRSPADNYRRALEKLETHLAQTSIPPTEQQLLALAGVGALAGWTVELGDDEHDLRVYPSGAAELDPIVVHRLGRALDRSPNEEPILWQQIHAAVALESDDHTLVLAGVRCLLDELPMNELDTAVATTVIDSIMGG